MLAPTDLIHPDPEQPVQTARIQFGGDHPFTRPSHAAPRHSGKSADRGLVHLDRQPRDQVIEVAGQVRPRPGEWHGLCHDLVDRTPQPSQRSAQLDPPHTQIQMPPHRLNRSGVVARSGPVFAVRAHQPSPTQRHRHHNQGGQELHGGDTYPVET